MRNAQQPLRRIVVLAMLGVTLAVPVALALVADPFGAVEVSDSTWRPGDLFTEPATVFAADGAGNALWASFVRTGSNDQMAIYERCGGSPATWRRSLVGAPDGHLVPMGLKVARNGTAMAVWRTGGAAAYTYSSSVRPAGGTWGAPETIVAGQTEQVQFALSDAGEAVAAWAQSGTGAGTKAALRPAGGTWQAPTTLTAVPRQFSVAMSAAGDAVVLALGTTQLEAYQRPAGGPWSTTAEKVIAGNSVVAFVQGFMVEFDGLGRAVALANWREATTDTIYVNVRSGGAWGTATVRDDDGDNPPNPLFGIRRLQALVRHPSGVVAMWLRSSQGQANHDLVASRFDGSWETPKVYDLPDAFSGAAAATNDAGEILLAGWLSHGNTDDIWATVVPSITAPWTGMTLRSPAGSGSDLYRNVVAAGGGLAFFLGWGVHGTGNQRSEVIATKGPAVSCDGTTATPTPTATTVPSPDPLPAPAPTVTPPAAEPKAQTAPPRAIADFTTLPSAASCIKNRKLTVRLKRPPKGYVVKTATVKVNGKRVATLKGRTLKKPLYLRKLPRGTFTVEVSIKLKKGRGLTEKRRYTACR